MVWLEIVAWIVVVALAIPLSVLAIECLAGLRRWKPAPIPSSSARPRCVVLIPAHDEELVIGHTLQQLARHLGADDRVVVVADNCSDGTATIARAQGAIVLERSDTERRGKGYALAFGRDSLLTNPPEVVVILDADCLLGEGTLHRLAQEALTHGRPAQAPYYMDAPPSAGLDRRVAAFAFLVKNIVRPSGLRRLGQSCILTGTGMAFPWEIIREARLGDGHIVEDLGLTVELALTSQTPRFIPEAEVRGEFPIDNTAAGSQRRRWEHGHLRVILSGVPRLLAAGVLRRRLDLIVMAFDIGVPPLSALMLIVAAALTSLLVWVICGGPLEPAIVLAGFWAFSTLALSAAWWVYGRATIPVKFITRIPLYAVKKIPLYLGFLRKPQSEWVRTARDVPPAAN